MRLSFIDAYEGTVVLLVISGMYYSPLENSVQVLTSDGDIWKCLDVSQYQHSIWSAKLLNDGYLSIHDTRYKWVFDE